MGPGADRMHIVELFQRCGIASASEHHLLPFAKIAKVATNALNLSLNLHDHAPPHFHVRYAGDSGIIQISNLEILSGDLPDRILRLVREWGSLHQEELMIAWQKATSNQTGKN